MPYCYVAVGGGQSASSAPAPSAAPQMGPMDIGPTAGDGSIIYAKEVRRQPTLSVRRS